MTDDAQSSPRGSAFPTTHWSMVVNAGAETQVRAQAALEALCRLYWYPIYAFVRRQGRTHHEAEDATQAFIAHLLSERGINRADREQGRFRAFLCGALRNFLINEWKKEQAAKRGGGQVIESLDWEDADDRFSRQIADPNLEPEQLFDREWVRGMIERAMSMLRAEYAKRRREPLFEVLSPLILKEPGSLALDPLAKELGMEPGAVGTALNRLRQRFGERLRTLVMETVHDPSEVDEELRYLIRCFQRQR